jgi:hypothetical protein
MQTAQVEPRAQEPRAWAHAGTRAALECRFLLRCAQDAQGPAQMHSARALDALAPTRPCPLAPVRACFGAPPALLVLALFQ